MIKGLFIALPTQESLHIQTAMSLFRVVEKITQQGIPHKVHYYSSSDIIMSRNRLAAAFLSNEDYTHIFFVDSDMSFEASVFDSLAQMNEPFVACGYPKRALDLEKFRKAVEAEAAKPIDDRAPTKELLSEILDFTLMEKDFCDNPWSFETRSGYFSVPGIGFGLALISRQVFVSMIENGCVDPYMPKGERYPRSTSYGFFNQVIRSDGYVLSEDLSFCKRWVADCGGKIWVLADPTISHVGSFSFSGSLADKFKRLTMAGKLKKSRKLHAGSEDS